MANGTHGAAASALGYLYQTEWPLIEIVRRSGDRPDFEMALELYDDVSWEEDGSPKELLQLKHHLNSERPLGDKDEDLWRTIALWMDAHDPSDPDGPLLILVTTQVAAEESACHALRPSSRNAALAAHLLGVAVVESEAQATAAARARFSQLGEAEREMFVGRIRVLDGSPGIEDLDAQLRQTLHLVLPRDHEDMYIDLLWRWWYKVAIGLLRGETRTISALDVSGQISDLRDQFSADSLPTLVERDDFDPNTEGDYSTRVFVQQLQWIGFSNPLLQKAIVDYFRAYTQSSRWVEDHLIRLDELDKFEENLRDEWERAFEFMKLHLPDDSDDASLAAAGTELFRAVTEQALVRVRERYSEAFFTRGKYHEMADGGRVGWHPEFEERLREVLLQTPR